MKINSITSFTNNSTASFQRSAVPYPEYQKLNAATFSRTAVPYPEYFYLSDEENENKNIVEALADKISELFHPDVRKEAAEIKAEIDSIYDEDESSGEAVAASQQLLSVLA